MIDSKAEKRMMIQHGYRRSILSKEKLERGFEE